MPVHSRFRRSTGQCLAIGLLALPVAVHSAHAADEKPAEGNAVTRTAKKAAKAVERGAKKADKALTNAVEKTDNWVKKKTK
ncbi:MAG TPA: hypothetical protein VGO02_00325 [Burkholderiales bacterium]|nr:hypothetical protein [Burkholderiales bacterium]